MLFNLIEKMCDNRFVNERTRGNINELVHQRAIIAITRVSIRFVDWLFLRVPRCNHILIPSGFTSRDNAEITIYARTVNVHAICIFAFAR